MEGLTRYGGVNNVWRGLQCMEGLTMYGGVYNVWRG